MKKLLFAIAVVGALCVPLFVSSTTTYAQTTTVSDSLTNPGLYNPSSTAVNPYDQPYTATPEIPSPGMSTKDSAESLIIRIANWTAALLGLAAFGYLVMAGFIYLTALDNEQAATKAKHMVVQVVIGVLVILSAYAIVFTLLGGRGRIFFY